MPAVQDAFWRCRSRIARAYMGLWGNGGADAPVDLAAIPQDQRALLTTDFAISCPADMGRAGLVLAKERRMVDRTGTHHLSSCRLKGIGPLRIAFGLIWAVDASFKWQPGFIGTFSDFLTGALERSHPRSRRGSTSEST